VKELKKRRLHKKTFRLFLALSCGLVYFLVSVPAFSQSPDTALPALSRVDALQDYRVGRDLESRGRMEDARGYYNEAVRICNDELARNAANMDSYTVLTWALQRLGRYAEVIRWGERALGINATDYRIIETMGEAYFYLDNYAESLRSMQRYANALPRGERTSVAYFFIGEIYRLQERYRHADIAYTTAVRLEPGAALWWYRLGSVREAWGDAAPAVEAYERALRLNPSYQEASNALTRLRG
jgi:tetratricopeptide (TPR) repeat protein